jgi:hypothetical protein
MKYCSLESTDISEERIAFISEVEEYAKKLSLLHAGFLLSFLFDPDMFLGNIGWRQTTRHYTPDDRNLHNNRSENLKKPQKVSRICI